MSDLAAGKLLTQKLRGDKKVVDSESGFRIE
jgi:hypothetical protein